MTLSEEQNTRPMAGLWLLIQKDGSDVFRHIFLTLVPDTTGQAGFPVTRVVADKAPGRSIPKIANLIHKSPLHGNATEKKTR